MVSNGVSPFQTTVGLGPSAESNIESWWKDKLRTYKAFLKSPIVDIKNAGSLTTAEHEALSARLDAANMALYRIGTDTPVTPDTVLALGAQFGLHHVERNLCAEDNSISEISASTDPSKKRYIPYTKHPLNWHTDGYYLADSSMIRAFVLHCNEQAWSGGENFLLDFEILFGLLSLDPNINVDALFAPDTFTIPANRHGAKELRGGVANPVFSLIQGCLHTRFSARQRNIHWKDDTDVLTAVEAIKYYLNRSPLILSIRLDAGMGMITRNVLHRRGSFINTHGKQRMFYRVRYMDAIGKQSLSANRYALAQ